jgi:crotonobetainyl-CoA:carnitine CoA-transferase CaiB-like acyl-CoA transferase
VLDHDSWPEQYPTAAARRAASAVIDAAVSAWTAQRTSREAFEALQAAGVPAMAVMTNEMLATDPHLAARGVLVEIDHPELGRTRVMRAPWLFSDLDIDVRPGPLLGQDNEYVLESILGLSAGDRADLGEVFR